jgi:hypothetical protein
MTSKMIPNFWQTTSGLRPTCFWMMNQTSRRPSAADCSGNAGDACTISCRTGVRTDGRGTVMRRPLNGIQRNNVRPGETGDSMVVRLREQILLVVMQNLAKINSLLLARKEPCTCIALTGVVAALALSAIVTNTIYSSVVQAYHCELLTHPFNLA